MYVNSKKKNKLVFLFFTVADYLSANQILLFSANLLYRSYERSDWGGQDVRSQGLKNKKCLLFGTALVFLQGTHVILKKQ